MERTYTGLFVSHIVSMASEMPAGEPGGAYDPTEQLWRDEGTVVAGGECKPALQSCSLNSTCCSDLCLLGLCL